MGAQRAKDRNRPWVWCHISYISKVIPEKLSTDKYGIDDTILSMFLQGIFPVSKILLPLTFFLGLSDFLLTSPGDGGAVMCLLDLLFTMLSAGA